MAHWRNSHSRRPLDQVRPTAEPPLAQLLHSDHREFGAVTLVFFAVVLLPMIIVGGLVLSYLLLVG